MNRINLKMAGYLDLPPMPDEYVSQLLSWHDKNKVLFDIYPFWVFTRMKRPDPLNWDKVFLNEYKHIREFIEDTLSPYVVIERVALLETVATVPDHTDTSAFEFSKDYDYEPSSVRIMIRNSDKDNFWLCPHKEEYWEKPSITYTDHGPLDFPKVYWKPKIGHWWALNNYCCYHGSDHHDGDRKTIMTIHGAPKKKYIELLNISKDMEGLWHPYSSIRDEI